VGDEYKSLLCAIGEDRVTPAEDTEADERLLDVDHEEEVRILDPPLVPTPQTESAVVVQRDTGMVNVEIMDLGDDTKSDGQFTASMEQTTDYILQTTDYRLQTTDYRLSTTDYLIVGTQNKTGANSLLSPSPQPPVKRRSLKLVSYLKAPASPPCSRATDYRP
jgi:predicted nucleic acid-binding protein